MFAYLPKINATRCGIHENNSSMKLYAKRTKQSISLIGENALRYQEGRPEERSYDACYFEISSERFKDTVVDLNITEPEPSEVDVLVTNDDEVSVP